MLHLIAYVVIGLVIGWWFSRGAGKPVLAVILGLVGGLVGGYLVQYGVLGKSTIIIKYGSLVASIILALILAVAGRGGRKA